MQISGYTVRTGTIGTTPVRERSSFDRSSRLLPSPSDIASRGSVQAMAEVRAVSAFDEPASRQRRLWLHSDSPASPAAGRAVATYLSTASLAVPQPAAMLAGVDLHV